MATAPIAKVVAPISKVVVPVSVPEVRKVEEMVTEVPQEILQEVSTEDIPEEVAPEVTEIDPEEDHKAWLLNSVPEGWTYGPEYDIDAKTSPWIRNYKALSGEEKAAFIARIAR